ncbi:hypothetical protein N2152v2_004736 [Parachlorella kessleri]
MQNSAPKASPGHPAGRAVPHCDQQDLERLRNQFGELEQQLAVLPLRIHLPANGQLLEKLGGGSPAAHGIKAPSYCSSTSEEAVLEPDSTSSRATCWATSQHDRGDTTAAEAGAKPLQTVSKLCMLARQRHRPDAGALPSAANNLTDWGPIQAAPRQWEHALTTPRVLEEAAARMQPRVAVKEQLQRLANDAALARPKAAGAPPSAHILADTEPTMSAAGAAVSACETDARRAEARAPASLHHPGSAGKHPEKDLASTQSYVDARPAGLTLEELLTKGPATTNDGVAQDDQGQGRKTVPVQANDDGVVQPIDLKCQCSDADPRGDLDGLVSVDCFYQRVFGNCNETYMFDANAELAPEGFCQVSCSRCNCCVPPYEALQQLNATRFLQRRLTATVDAQALDAASPSLKELFQHPGYMNTILVPTDAAWDAVLEKYGPKISNPAVLQEILKFHILPPEPVRRGLWTTPFFSLGPKLYTAYDGPSTLSVKRFPLPASVTWQGGITGFSIDGPLNSASVVQSDILACKSVLTVIDSVLLPFDPNTLPTEDWLAPSAALGAPGCFVQPNGMITGATIKAGDSNIQKGGCRMPDGKAFKFGFCELKTSAELAQGLPANYSDYSAITVPFISGYTGAPLGTSSSGAPLTEPTVTAADRGL